MIILISGVNGSSKTLSAIKMISEDSQFQGRTVYYYNVDGVKSDWIELSHDEVLRWYELPQGSVVFIDECYKVFPTRKAGVKVPLSVERLAEHRKEGIDLILVCQKPVGQIDTFVRGLVGKYIHLDRKFSSKFVTRYTYSRFVDNPLDYHNKKEAVIDQVKLDKKYFGAYKSAELHTHKSFFPWRKVVIVIIAIAFTIACFVVGVRAFKGFGGLGGDDEQSVVVGSPLAMLGGGLNAGPVLGYFELRKPRVEGFPHTSPIYDSLTSPVTYPRLQCVLYVERDVEGSCVCYTQQATRLQTPHDVCVSVVTYGYFDHALPDAAGRAGGGDGFSRPASASGLSL